MNLSQIAKDKAQAKTDEIIAKVAAQFANKETKIWLSGYSRDEVEAAAMQLRPENREWSFSIDEHKSSGGCYLVIEYSRLAKSGEIGDH